MEIDEGPLPEMWQAAIKKIDAMFPDLPPIFDPNVRRHNEAINLLMWTVRRLMEKIETIERK